MYLAVPLDFQQDYMLAMQIHQQILKAGMSHSIEILQVVQAVQLEIVVKPQLYSGREYSVEVQALRMGNKEPMMPHLATKKKRLLLPRSAHEKLYRHEVDSEHAHFQREEEFHVLKEDEHYPLIVYQIAVESHKRSSSLGEHLGRLKTLLRGHNSQEQLVQLDLTTRFNLPPVYSSVDGMVPVSFRQARTSRGRLT